MKKLMIIGLALGAVYWFRPEWLPAGFPGGSAPGGSDVVVFTFSGCGQPCRDVLAVLQQKQVAYEQVDLTATPAAESRLRQLGGGNQLPYTVIGPHRLVGYQRTSLTHALADVFGLAYLDASQREVVSKHFDGNGNPEVVMYATEWCPYCKKAREFFAAENIPYREVDAEKSAQGRRDYAALQSSGYPLIYVGVTRIDGLQTRAIKQAVKE